MENGIGSALEKCVGNSIIMAELPETNYFEACTGIVRTLTEKGYGGVYVSFQRPFNNITNMLAKNKINTSGMLFVDVASATINERSACKKSKKCVPISEEMDIDEIVRAIYTSLPKLKNGNRFIFIDSVTTLTLHKPLSESMRFFEFLMREVRKHGEKENVVLVLNVAKNLAEKKFIRDIALDVDGVVKVVA